MLWICLLAFVCGILVSSQYYEFQCNKHIVEEFYPEISCLNGWKCNRSLREPGSLEEKQGVIE